ncbi:MAG TPA: hypothetical protein VIL85_05765 [Thermomicrobiales bacterium]|jgi:hypothetical protein
MGQLPNGGRAPRSLFFRDIVQGALLGDFARDLGLPGAVVQVALNFVPVVGSICAMRDAVANWRVKDRPGVALNLLAIVPVIGSVAKVAELWRHMGRLRRGFDVSFRIRRQQPAG